MDSASVNDMAAAMWNAVLHEPEPMPEGFYSIDEIAQLLGKSKDQTYTNLTRKLKAGQVERRYVRLARPGQRAQRRAVYKPVDPQKRTVVKV